MQPTTQQAIATKIGSARLSTYLQEASGNHTKALELYLWNLEAAAAVISTTSLVEVYLRNTIDLAVGNWNISQRYTLEPGRTSPYSREWLLDPSPRLKNDIVKPGTPQSLLDAGEKSMKDINNQRTKPTPTHDDYIAGLTFGTWTYILPHPTAGTNNIRVDIWDNELSKHFSKPRKTVYYWAQHLRYARNRSSHLEPLLNISELQHFHRCASRLLNSLDPAAASWFAGQAYLPTVISKKP